MTIQEKLDAIKSVEDYEVEVKNKLEEIIKHTYDYFCHAHHKNLEFIFEFLTKTHFSRVYNNIMINLNCQSFSPICVFFSQHFVLSEEQYCAIKPGN